MSRRLPLLDLGCGAGGASWGYWLSGLWRPVGLDVKPQPNYPFMLLEMDVRELSPAAIADEFAGVHASMPCQRWSTITKRNGTQENFPDLVGYVRELLTEAGVPWVMENVTGAPLREPELACGGALNILIPGYRLKRHRHFESSVDVDLQLDGCGCARWSSLPVIDVSGGGPGTAPRLDGAGGRTYKGTADQVRALMGMPWATKTECNEAIPPAYTSGKVAQALYVAARQRLAGNSKYSGLARAVA